MEKVVMALTLISMVTAGTALLLMAVYLIVSELMR